jgi:hypothetical protein
MTSIKCPAVSSDGMQRESFSARVLGKLLGENVVLVDGQSYIIFVETGYNKR